MPTPSFDKLPSLLTLDDAGLSLLKSAFGMKTAHLIALRAKIVLEAPAHPERQQ